MTHIRERVADAVKARKAAIEARRNGQLPPLPRIGDYRAAIRSKCVECMGGAFGDGLRESVRECTAVPTSDVPCPLWLYRPWQ